jgi:hypothetical protein
MTGRAQKKENYSLKYDVRVIEYRFLSPPGMWREEICLIVGRESG